jgi:hypothetical protein
LKNNAIGRIHIFRDSVEFFSRFFQKLFSGILCRGNDRCAACVSASRSYQTGLNGIHQ